MSFVGVGTRFSFCFMQELEEKMFMLYISHSIFYIYNILETLHKHMLVHDALKRILGLFVITTELIFCVSFLKKSVKPLLSIWVKNTY